MSRTRVRPAHRFALPSAAMRSAAAHSRFFACTVLCASLLASRASAQDAPRSSADLVHEHRERELRAALLDVQREQTDTTRLLPWLVLGAGIAMAATGMVVGAGEAIACDDSCTGPFWPAWLVVAGAAAGTAGGIWLVLKNREIAELRSRRYRIETELQYLQWSTEDYTRVQAASAQRFALRLRFAF